MEKNYKHDCEQCIYLGEFQEGTQVYDLYHCGKGPWGSYIARYGNRPEEYASFPKFIVEDEAREIGSLFKECLRRKKALD